MAGPWERYQQAAPPASAGPWQRYQQPTASPGEQFRAPLPMNAVQWFTQTQGRAPTPEEIAQGLPDTLRWQQDRAGVEAWDQALGVHQQEDLLADNYDPDTLGNRFLTGANSALFNWGDELYGLIAGQDAREDLNRQLGQFAAVNPGDASRASLIGGLVSGVATMGVPLLNAGRAAGLGGQMLRSAAAGALGGAASRAGAAEGTARERLMPALDGALLGGAIGAAVPVAARGLGLSAPTVSMRTGHMTGDELRAEARGGYAAVGAEPIRVAGDRFDAIGQRLTQSYERALDGFTDTGQTPVAQRALSWVIDNTSGSGNRSVSQLETARQALSGWRAEAARSGNERDLLRVDALIDEYDDWLEGLRPEDLAVGGDIQGAVDALARARQTWRDMSRTTEIERIVQRARDQATVNYTNADWTTAVRREFARLQNDPRRRIRVFTPEEREAIDAIVNQSTTDNILRFFSRFAPRGFFSGGMALYGVANTEPIMMFLTGAGEASRRLLRRRTEGQINDLLGLTSGAGRPLVPPAPGMLPEGAMTPFGVVAEKYPFLPPEGALLSGNLFGAVNAGSVGLGREGSGRPSLIAPVLNYFAPGGVPRLGQ